MVLAGYKPEIILEMASRALSFWSYQVHNELMYQEYVSSKAKDKALQLDQDYSAIIQRTKSEITGILSKLVTCFYN